MEVLIHAAPERIHYVKGFLVPRLMRQGFDNIHVWEDVHHKGNLKAYLESYQSLPFDGDTWHLEDDVLPDSRFYTWAKGLENYQGIINGYGTRGLFSERMFGEVRMLQHMFYSFPCIRIPNDLIHLFLEWFETCNRNDVKRKIEQNRGIDFILRAYLEEHPTPCLNHNPCMVEHIDDYLTGSLISIRAETPKAIRFEDTDSLEEMKQWLKAEQTRDGKTAGVGNSKPDSAP